ncbi:MAG: hypothetical protein HQM13_19700 [SAR324 cluster bacterium]|nr:hypothetical protein [SAR324 cluster bacterium]
MIDCCNSSKSTSGAPSSHICPINGKSYQIVESKTVLHHLRSPWDYEEKDYQHYFCDDPECDVVYFTNQGSVICKDRLRTSIGQKEKGDDRILCYCFGVSAKQVDENPSIKGFVIEQTKNQNCDCETRNPSGHCCLKNFPRGK